MTPVWIAAYKNYPEILKLLLYNFADPTVCAAGTFGYPTIEYAPLHEYPVSPLYIALKRNSSECFNVLMQAGYEIHKESWLLEGDYPVEMVHPCVDCCDYYGEHDLGFQKAERKKDCKVKENIALLNDLLSRSPTLLSLCRTFIRKRAGRRLLTCVSELGLPRHLEGYLTLADFKTKSI